MPTWVWAIGPAPSRAGSKRRLASAYGRTVTWHVDRHAFAQFSLDARGEECADIIPLATDLWIWRDSVLVFRGRIVSYSAGLDADEHTVQFSAMDYRWMLANAANLAADRTFAATAQATIAWTLVDEWQARGAGYLWDITQGDAPAGNNRDDTIRAGRFVGEYIEDLGRRENGFEWAVEPGATEDSLELNIASPQRGTDKSATVKLHYGRHVTDVQYTQGSQQFANTGVVTGSSTTVAVPFEAANVNTDERGAWAATVGYPTVELQASLDAKAVFAETQSGTLRPQFAATLVSADPANPDLGWGGPSHIREGDTVTFGVKDGWLDFEEPHRAVELQAVIGESGEETVRLGLAKA